MNHQQKTIAGILLCIVGFIFYCESALTTGYLSATRNDFAHLYLAGYLADRGGDFFSDLIIYTHTHLHIPTGLNPFVYPPFFAILLIPLSYFSYNMAWFFFTMLSHAAFFASLALTVRIIRKDEEPAVFWWGILMALSACYYPVMKTYSAGQMNTFMLLVITGGAYLLSRKRDLEAGALIGLGAAIKITPALFLIYCCWTKRWKAAVAGATVLILSLAVSWIVLGGEVHSSFLSMAKEMGYGSSTWAQHGMTYHTDPFNQAPSALWYRLFTSTETAQFGTIQGILDSPAFAKAMSYLSALSVLALLLFITRRGSDRTFMSDFGLWTIGMLLIPSLLWDHYLVQALFPVAVALHTALNGSRKNIYLLGFSIAILAIPFFHHLPLFRQGWWTLFMSFKLIGLLLLILYLILNRECDKITTQDYTA